MKMKLFISIPATLALFLVTCAFSVNAFAVDGNVETAVVISCDEQTDDSSKESDGKDKRKKKKGKKKKDKEAKSPEEIMAMIMALEWKKPAKSGLDVDKYYDEADQFFKLIKSVDQRVPLFKVYKITSPSGESTIAPVDIKTGEVRHKNEATNQVLESVSFGADLALQSTSLAAGALTYSVQIAQDAIPFVGNAERKTANVQIAKAVKTFPLLKQLIDSQRNMMDRYFKQNANIEANDSVSEAITTGDIDFLDTIDMSDEELAAYMEAEEAASK